MRFIRQKERFTIWNNEAPESETRYPITLKCGNLTIDTYRTIEEAQADVQYWTKRCLEVGLGIGLPIIKDSFMHKLFTEWYKMGGGA